MRSRPGEEKQDRDLLPLAAAVLVGVIGTAALSVALPLGLLGPDVGRGAEFCERWHRGCLKQPVNTLSNVAFVLAGLLSGTELGGALDLLSMHLVASFAAAHGAARLSPSSDVATFWVCFPGFLVVAQMSALVPGGVPVVTHPENVAFIVLLLIAVVTESARGSAYRSEPRWLVASAAVLTVAFVVWNLAQGPWCDPDSWLQGHAAWHVLCALSCVLLARFYSSEGERP